MPDVPKLSYLPDFEGRTSLYSRIDHVIGQIRVLTVWPNEDFSSRLEASLQIRTLSSDYGRETYTALSYFWGSANELESVLVHGSDNGESTLSCEVPVTKNLTFALRHLRQQATAAGWPLEIWTDAICINQRDHVERSQQVVILAAIYQHSRGVHVWLSDRGSSKAARKGFEHFVNLCDRFGSHTYTREQQLEQVTILVAGQDRTAASELINTIGALMDVPYWRRGWTLQEVLIANVPICLSFEDQTSCNLTSLEPLSMTLRALCDFANSRRLYDGSMSLLYSSDVIGLLFLNVPRLQSASVSYPADFRLYARKQLDFFLTTKMWHTSDPRDSVFVLQSFHPAFKGMRADYSATVEEVFTEATLRLLDRTRTWSHACWSRASQSPYLPSWVFDFSTNVIHTGSMHRSHLESDLLFHGKFDASASSDLRGIFTAPQMLSTNAFICDEIEHISSWVPLSRRGSVSESQHIWHEWLDLIRDYTPQDPVAVFRTICGGLAIGQKRFAATDVKLFTDHPIGRGLNVTGGPELNITQEAFNKWWLWISGLAAHQRFFFTKGGRMGLAPGEAAEGDHLAIFASGDLPFVVRKVHTDIHPAAHIMLGTCYLDGKTSSPHLSNDVWNAQMLRHV
jgi:hypothetical protein